MTEKKEGREKDLREWKLCAFIFFPLYAITEYDKSFWNKSTMMNIATHDLKWCIFGKNKIFDKFTIDLKTNVGHHLLFVQSWYYHLWRYKKRNLVNNDNWIAFIDYNISTNLGKDSFFDLVLHTFLYLKYILY